MRAPGISFLLFLLFRLLLRLDDLLRNNKGYYSLSQVVPSAALIY